MIAYLISTEGNLSPAAMVTKLTTRAIPVLSNIREFMVNIPRSLRRHLMPLGQRPEPPTDLHS